MPPILFPVNLRVADRADLTRQTHGKFFATANVLLEKPSHLGTAQRLLQNNFAGAVDAMDLENVLGQIKADCGNLHRGWILWLVVA